MDEVSESHLKDVHPELARRVRLLAAKCALNGIVIRVTCGVRNWADQTELYNEGRITPGKIVTDAMAGYSAHQFGYAVDIVPGEDGWPEFTPDWDAMDPRWKQVLQMANLCHLAEGAQWRTFPDRPHLYLEELPPNPTEEMRSTFKQGGMTATWSNFPRIQNVQVP
jgi:peptidoglycan LD-endopeptidase CwlK